MATLTMPNIGEGVAEGTVTRWLLHEGDSVERDQPVVEVETDKAVVQVPSPFAGRLMRIVVTEGATVPVGAALAEFETADASDSAHAPQSTGHGTEQGGTPRREPPAAPRRAPEPARSAAEPPAEPSEPPAPRTAAVAPRPPATDGAWYSPAVLRLAAEHRSDLGAIAGTGAGGRVTRRDVLRHLGRAEAPVDGATAPAAATASATEAPAPLVAPEREPRPAGDDDVERVPLSATRRSIARHMTQSHQTIPAAWMVVEADVTGLVALREEVKEPFVAREGVPLTYLPFCVQAIVAALKEHPHVNASYSDEGMDVHHRFHVSIAVATDSGLLTPVLRDADRKSITGLARELDDLGRRARERTLTAEELRGAAFTVNNTGAFGSVISQPIVPVGQTAIVTTEVVRRELRVLADGTFGPRSVMNLCISFDHRALDGAEAGAFMREVVRQLEAYQPGRPVH